MSAFSLAHSQDTIVAIATPPGKGALGIVRLTGTEAIRLVSRVFTGHNLTEVDSHTIHFGKISSQSGLIDEVLVSVFKAPHSYTSENVVEISCHGSPYILNQVVTLMVELGARLAQPGEFTLRAFLNGRMDLVQAEAVADLVASDTAASHQVAINQLRGGFSQALKILREKLIHFASMLELELDFSEEDVEFASRRDLKSLLTELRTLITNLTESFVTGNAIKNGVPTVIAGKPNSGKSTLLNALLNEEKAIVSDIEGTTRDLIEDEIHIEGISFRFIDTAGIREARDKIEEMGIERTRQKMKQASVIIYMFDLSREDLAGMAHQESELKRLGIPCILTGNKTDLAPPALLDEMGKQGDYVLISARNRDNLDRLKKRLIEMLDIGKIHAGDVIVTNARHYESLFHARSSVEDIMTGLENKAGTDLLAEDLRQAIYYLGEITGEITNDDLLGNIFSKFCIGK